ncbi:MAG: LTA synthase family protein [Prevotella sp.]|nr:LTA synthase family protein [Prevotella sp.]
MAANNFRNKKIHILQILPIANLLYMHYSFYYSGSLEWTWQYSEILNILSIIFDVTILYLVGLLLFLGRTKPAFGFSNLITLIWAFVNTVYGRFFFQYLPLSAVAEAHGLQEGIVIDSIIEEFRWTDLFFVISFLLFIWQYRKIESFRIKTRIISKIVLIPVVSLILTIGVYSAYHFIHPKYRNNFDLLEFRIKEFLFDPIRGGTPNLAHFQTGCVRTITYELYNTLTPFELNDQQRKEIVTYYKDSSYRFTPHQTNPNIRNVIFILLESFLSSPIDLTIDGKEITPFLNSLKRDSSVYYNGNVISDITCGESGDGQFIYMNGILPLRYKMTVGQVKKNTLPALPKLLSEQFGIKNTEIIQPAGPNLWQQADMNSVYGIQNMYSEKDIKQKLGTSNIDDAEIFEFASKKLPSSGDPFFSLILSVSTHRPYDKFFGENLISGNNTLPVEYRNYLNTCHYTDTQLHRYFTALKEKNLYEHSLIIIAADHYAHLDALKMNKKITRDTPLFIINGNIKKDTAWTGEIHQLDVYTTILNILGIDREWKGLGHTIIAPTYKNSVDTHTYDISEMIIEGDYFRVDDH